MKKIVLALCMLIAITAVFALTAGDIAIIGVLADNPDVIGFVSLVDVPGGTVISFCDRGWRNTEQSFSTAAPLEGFLRWSPPAGGVPAGTFVTLTSAGVAGTDPFYASIGSVTEVQNFQISYDSDQVLAFEGTTAPTSNSSALWLWGFSLSNWGWASNAYTSDLPSALIGYEVHFSTTGGQYAGVDNAWYGTTNVTGTREELLDLFSNPANYIATDDYTSQLPSYVITLDDGTVPVVLSSFTATISSENFVNLTWVSQSETAMSGYFIYRSQTDLLSEAQLISPMIPAANSSTQQIYTFTDDELTANGVYYYWLQSVDLDGSDAFHGPVAAYFNAHGEYSAPEIPLATELKAVYPNPFNPTVFIPYSLASSADVSFRIYNTRGQSVRDFAPGKQAPGNYSISWDGTDNNGQNLPTGVYYIRMAAGNQVFQRKAALIK